MIVPGGSWALNGCAWSCPAADLRAIRASPAPAGPRRFFRFARAARQRHYDEAGRSPRIPLHHRGDDRRTTYRTRSTYGKEGATLNLDIDPRTHPAWTGGQQTLLDRGGRVSRFAAKYGGFLKG
jgi:large subunit ribosomal protein L31